MRTYPAILRELRLEAPAERLAWIACSPACWPVAGQYMLAHAPNDITAPLATVLFAVETSIDLQPAGFLAAGSFPSSWEPGTELELRGPLGRGFQLPPSANRLALATLGTSASGLRLLIQQGIERQVAIAIYADCPLPRLSSAVEIYPLSNLPEALPWADMLALELDRQAFPQLRVLLGIREDEKLPCPAQALIHTSLSCGGAAECGVCAAPTRRGWKQACSYGPVFDLQELNW